MDLIAYKASKTYTDNTAEEFGALKGASAQIQSIVPITGGNRVTFEWVNSEGATRTSTLDVMNGTDGKDAVQIANITVNASNQILVEMEDGTIYTTATVPTAKGEPGKDGFSPEITVEKNTPDIYRLKIKTEDEEFVTPNLKGGGSGSMQVDELPTPTEVFEGKVYQYIGKTTSEYTHNYFYECVGNNGVYSWQKTNVQDSSNSIQVSLLPTPSAELLGEVRQYIGTTTEDYIHNYFYECVEETVEENITYKWVQASVDESTQFEVLPEASEKWLNRIVQFTGNAPYTNGYFYKCVLNQGQYEWIEWYVMRTMTTPALVDVSGASIERVHRVATIRWTDPEDSEISGQVQAEWGGTKLLRKIGSAPQNEEDGELITNSVVRNQYSEDGFVDDTLEYDKVYYYRFFPYSTINVVTKGTAIMVNCKRDIVPLPTQTVPLYYNGKNQTPTLSSSVGIVKSGETSGKDVGQYTMTLSLESNDYVWADNTYTDKILTWTIGKHSL
jgi:hypothetical protein